MWIDWFAELKVPRWDISVRLGPAPAWSSPGAVAQGIIARPWAVIAGPSHIKANLVSCTSRSETVWQEDISVHLYPCTGLELVQEAGKLHVDI